MAVGKPCIKTIQVVGSAFLVNFVCYGIDCVDTVKAYASLEAGAGLLSENPEELNLLDKILYVLMHVGEAANDPARQMGSGSCQITILVFAG